MLKVLVPVDGSSNSLHAVRHVLSEFRRNPATDIHLLNVQPPFSRNVTRWIDRKTVNEAHLEASEQALRPTRKMLDDVCVPYSVHLAVGGKASSIAEFARQLRCDHIVIGTARKNSLIRTIEGSVTNKVLELTTVPVIAVAGDPPSTWERYGIQWGVGGGFAWLVVAALE
jgi:nucleotide-binding universal stress UspA family protein